MKAHEAHSAEEMCQAGTELYARALREGRVRREDTAGIPCLIDFGLLHPNIEDMHWLEPVAPAVALHRLLRNVEDHIADERRREVRLAEAFEPLMRIDGRHTAPAQASSITVLSGKPRINSAISEAMTDATLELLTIQPNIGRSSADEATALERDRALLDRGARIRTLYPHTMRHSMSIIARYEELTGDIEVRTLDEVTSRLIVIDRTVAFIPAARDRTLALEVRQPALIDYFFVTFDRLWRLATPMYPEAVQPPTLNGITPRQRAIAALLIEGHTDTAIAERLGMNVRTARVHIAKLATTLGSESRAQLGYLIGQSGILKQES
ncbi:helix-turn-helix transcriptional regulator [Streptomyces sp. KM273126]|uniref:helix-turn-helix transcriptional regulator n=1 Tax=Streptomyces sp. KM273126 TaxID=2545247 RepID=UPI00103AEF3C|nr:helix-turn-helix transcriptional regulator [Streptomyces sp. KM273126]MBA2807829.1 helix-turn-helix transcriptional regulator [Streptomyces sp. KM273126]